MADLKCRLFVFSNMLTEKQYDIAGKVLEAIKKQGGRCNMDQFYNALPDYDDHVMDYEYMKKMLMDQYHAIEYIGKDEYWISLTPNGYRLSETGLKEHNKKVDRVEKLKGWKLILEVINAGLTLGNFICAIVAFTAGILLSDPIKSILRKLLGSLIE